jgi:hypothetical protein
VQIISDDKVFPALDVFRILLTNAEVVRHQLHHPDSALLHILEEHFSSAKVFSTFSEGTKMLLMACLTNILYTNEITEKHGSKVLFSADLLHVIMDCITAVMEDPNSSPSLRFASVSVASNMALFIPQELNSENEERMVQTLTKQLLCDECDGVRSILLVLYRSMIKNKKCVQVVCSVPVIWSEIARKEDCADLAAVIIHLLQHIYK